MRRWRVLLVFPVAALFLQACASQPQASAPDTLQAEMSTLQRLLPGSYMGETPKGTVELRIRPAPGYRFLVEARETASSRLLERGELTLLGDMRHVRVLYRPGPPGLDMAGRRMDEPPGLSLDRDPMATQIRCGLWVDPPGADAPFEGEAVRCVSPSHGKWQVSLDAAGIELRRGKGEPIRMLRTSS